jgi:hypothetical protein
MAPIGEPFEYPEREGPGQVVPTPDGLWGILRLGNQVVKIDPETGELTDRHSLNSPYSSQPAEIASMGYGAGALWVTTHIGNRAGVIVLD